MTTLVTDRLFTGQQHQAGSTIYHCGARLYNTATGRFVHADPRIPPRRRPALGGLDIVSHHRDDALRATLAKGDAPMRPFGHRLHPPAHRPCRVLFGVAALVVVAVSLACGSGGSAGSPTATPSPTATVGPTSTPAPTASLTAEAGPVTITLVDVATTSTRSKFTFEFATDVPPPPFGGRSVLVHGVSVTGVEPIRPVVPGHDTPDDETYIVDAGPPTFDAPLVVTVDALLLRRDDGNERIVGPWSFTVPVEQLEPDPVDHVVEMNETVEAEGVKVTVDELRFSSNEILVLYTLSSGLHLSDDMSLGVLMEFPDGVVIYNDHVEGGYTGPPRNWVGEHVTSFPPLPDGVTTFKLRFGPYLTPIPGGVTRITLPDAASLTTPGLYEVESATESLGGDQTLVAEELVIRDDTFAVRMRPNPDSIGQVAGLPSAEIHIADDIGNSYMGAGRGVGFGQTDDRTIFFREDVVDGQGSIDPAATTLIVRVTAFAMLLSGPWEIDVESPLTGG